MLIPPPRTEHSVWTKNLEVALLQVRPQGPTTQLLRSANNCRQWMGIWFKGDTTAPMISMGSVENGFVSRGDIFLELGIVGGKGSDLRKYW